MSVVFHEAEERADPIARGKLTIEDNGNYLVFTIDYGSGGLRGDHHLKG
jgi:hypothetical protein